MKINDKRCSGELVTFENMVAGRVYIDVYGSYIIATDEDKIVNLDCGTLSGEGEYTSEDHFTPVNARLEIE